jgi:hypothetical protein
LGFPLFERLPRGVQLTSMGVAYLPPERPQRMRREVQLFRDWPLSAAAVGS